MSSLMYPVVKGDQLCPLGFHPQVRWPTRCKRCFRDYKEHGNKRSGDDVTASTPAITRSREISTSIEKPVRSWTSTTNLSNATHEDVGSFSFRQRPASWASTPDLEKDGHHTEVTVNVPFPRRRPFSMIDRTDDQVSVTIKRPPLPPSALGKHEEPKKTENKHEEVPEIERSDSLAERVRKMNLLRKQSSLEKEGSVERDSQDKPQVEKAERRRRRIAAEALSTSTSTSTPTPAPTPVEEPKKVEVTKPEIQKVEPPPETPTTSTTVKIIRRRRIFPSDGPGEASKSSLPPITEKPKTVVKTAIKPVDAQPPPTATAPSVKPTPTSVLTKTVQPPAQTISEESKFLFQVKDKAVKKADDALSTTTENTIVDRNDKELLDEIESLRRELEMVKSRCERAERDKSDILLRRLASIDTVPNKTAASEVLKLQQKFNDLTQVVEDLKDEKKFLSVKVKELESDAKNRPNKNMEDELKDKYLQAEKLCEELMDENEELKRELRNMETEIDEMHDNFREEQADEYATLKKELDQTTKNCRILSFKLKKSDRKIEQLESEKRALGANMDLVVRVKQLEDELSVANEVARRLQNELEQNQTDPTARKAPTLGRIGKSTSADGKIKRESLTRGGSQEDPVQLLRDLQDSLEREADLREQLKFAEEESENMRKKSSRVEDENESLVMQLKKMATKAKTRKPSPSPIRSRNIPIEKDEGISDEEDPAELRLQLELNEQETSVLRRKVEDLEMDGKNQRQQIKDLNENLAVKTKEVELITKKNPISAIRGTGIKDPLEDKKIKVMEDEISELRMKLIEKDREFERVQAEMSLNKGKKLIKSKSLESSILDQQTLDLKRQLQVVEQEATVLRSKTQTLEQENDNYLAEIKKLQLQAARQKTIATNAEIKKLKDSLEVVEKEKDEIEAKLNRIMDESGKGLPSRMSKVVTDMHTKLQLKKMIEECESEIGELRAMVVKAGGQNVKDIEKAKDILEKQLFETKEKLQKAEIDLSLLKASKDTSEVYASRLTDAQQKVQKLDDDNKKQNEKIKILEDKIVKLTSSSKLIESSKTSLETQLKHAKEKCTNAEKDLEREKKDKQKYEHKTSELEAEIHVVKRNADRTKENLENEIEKLKSKSSAIELPSKKLQELKTQNEALMAEIGDQSLQISNLTSKCEALQEEHVLFKAENSSEKKGIQQELQSVRNKLSESESNETRMKRENTELSKKLVESSRKLTALESSGGRNVELERNRLRSQLEDKQREYEHLSRENEVNAYQLSQIKKENDDLKSKLDDYERINKVQRNLNDHNNNLEQEVKKLKVKLENSELAVKSEVAATRLRYEQQVNNLHHELTTMQHQCERFKKDRDTFKQLVEAAQKQISDMKANRKTIITSSSDDDDKSKMVGLEQQIGCLEDELSEARLEASKVRTELVSELTAAEIKMSEMQSKLNELEEDKILGGGKGKVSGTKTRLELSWQKEREELSRLLQETSTLARDLRQTLFEVERERDKERLESKRKIDQIKKTTEEEIEEGRRKVSELQSDLLELRDAHAKLRTANEKLRRDRDRYEREREYLLKRRIEHDGERKVGALLQTVDELVKIAPDLQIISRPKDASDKTPTTLNAPIPTPPRRSKSRSPSPGPGGETHQLPISTVLSRLAEASEELRRYQRYCDDERERDRRTRSGMRRAASTENDNMLEVNPNRPILRVQRPGGPGSLYRKSLSLDQSMQSEQAGLIWKEGDESMSSLQSLDSEYGLMRRDGSMDSRLSGGSTQSDMPRMRKKKRGLMGRLRSLASRGTESDVSQQGSESDLSLAGDVRSSKTNLKGRLSGMFKRSGSQTRSTEVLDSRPIPVATHTIENGPASTSSYASVVTQNNSHTTPHLPVTSKPPTPSAPPSQRRRVASTQQNK